MDWRKRRAEPATSMRYLPLFCSLCLFSAAAQTASVAAYPSQLALSAAAGSNPVMQPVAVSPSDPGADWTASANSAWLVLSPSAGTGSTTITASANTDGLTPGLYTDTIRFRVSDGSTALVVVTLRLGIPAGAASANQWHVTVDGTPDGDGSTDKPWDVVTALNGPKQVQPGDTVWLHGGKHGAGTFDAIIASHLVGTPAAPIVVRAAPGERPIVDAWLQIGCCDGAGDARRGAYTWFWGIEFAGYNPDRSSAASGPPDWARQANHGGVDAWAPGTKIIDCIVHDTSSGISIWQEASDSEAYGNLVYNVGGFGPDRGHGHGFYLQNAGPGVKHIFDNIAFNNFGEGIQIFGSDSAPVQNFHLQGNISFNNGSVGTGSNGANGTPMAGSRSDNIIIGQGSGGPKGMLLINNFTYHTPMADDGTNELGYGAPRAGDLVAVGNYFIGGSDAVNLLRWDSIVFRDNRIYAPHRNETSLTYRTDQNPSKYNFDYNTYYGAGNFSVFPACNNDPCPQRSDVPFNVWQSIARVDANSSFQSGAPLEAWTSVRPNLYEPGRAGIVVYNWNQWPIVNVDIRNAGIRIGDRFEVRDAQDWFGPPVLSGVYVGQQLSIPMTGLPIAFPNGNVPNPQPHTSAEFGAFVVLSGASLSAPAAGVN
jgi:hypothetical protein